VPKKTSVVVSHPHFNSSKISSHPPIVPRLLRIQDAAKYLSATTWFVETLIRERKIPFLVLGKRYVIDSRDLDRWIENRKGVAA